MAQRTFIDSLEPRCLCAVDFSQYVNPGEVRTLLTGDVARFDGGLLRDANGNLVKDATGKAKPDTTTRSATASNAKGGMGAFVSSFDGFFRISQLDRQFNNKANPWADTWAGSSISQSRAVYINATAARWETDATLAAKFKAAATKGADFLARPLDAAAKSYGFADPVNGGYFWELAPAGTASKPDYSSYVKWDGAKDGYGQSHPVFALVAAYTAGGGAGYLDKAAASWAAYLSRFRDTSYTGPHAAGAILPKQSEDFSAVTGTRNQNDLCHALEAGIALYNALPANDARRAGVRDDVNAIGDFIVHVTTRDEPGSGGTRAYVPWKFDAAWTPIDSAGTSIGHQVEFAYLLSRAVEVGLGDTSWLAASDKLLAYGLKYGLAAKGDAGQYRFLVQDTVNFDGTDSATEPGENLGWWQQIELLRATANAIAIRGREDLGEVFTKAWAGFREKFVDSTYGGTYAWIDPVTLKGPWAKPGSSWQDNAKGWEWKVDYHESMMYDELLRLVMLTAPPTPPPPTTGTASLAGNVFKDNNANGKYDTGDGIGSGVVVFLDADNDGVLDSTESRVTTDAKGKFTFSKLPAGTYHVRRVLASGTVYSTAKIDLSLANGQAKTGLLIGSKKA